MVSVTLLAYNAEAQCAGMTYYRTDGRSPEAPTIDQPARPAALPAKPIRWRINVPDGSAFPSDQQIKPWRIMTLDEVIEMPLAR